MPTVTPADIAAHLTRLTGDTWQGLTQDDSTLYRFKLRRERDALTLDAYAGYRGGTVQDPWAVSLNLYRGGEYGGGGSWLGDHLPYFSSKERAKDAGKPWGRVTDDAGNRSINIGQGKTAEQFAKDVVKRLLPKVEPAWDCVIKADGAHREYVDRAAKVADDLAAVVGVPARHSDNSHTVDLGTLCTIGTAECYPERVTLTLRGLSVDQARLVLALLKGVEVVA